jgi:8-oxo-dGTP pyrophosphatase MutT (NUDIX family)
MASNFNGPESDMDTAVINMLLKPHELQKIPKIKVLNKDVQFKPVCKRNTTYIVAVVLLNDKDQICLVQEAKASCKNKWYLPAGRMEPNESLNGAVRRECKEEAGYEIDPC